MSDRVVSVKSHPFCEHGRGACNIIGSLQDVVHIAITFSSCVWDPLGIWYHGGLHSRSFDSVSFSFQVSFTPPNTHNKNKYRKKTRTKRGKKTVRVPCPFSSLAPPLAAPLLPRLLGNGCARIEVEALVLRAHLLHLKAEAGQSVRRVEHPTVEVKQGPKGEGRGTL